MTKKELLILSLKFWTLLLLFCFLGYTWGYSRLLTAYYSGFAPGSALGNHVDQILIKRKQQARALSFELFL